jgi:hypothetical protein
MDLLRTQPAQASAVIVAELRLQLMTHRGLVTPIMIARQLSTVLDGPKFVHIEPCRGMLTCAFRMSTI